MLYIKSLLFKLKNLLSLLDESVFVKLLVLLDYVKPDFVHIIQDGKIIKTGNASLARVLEERGYEWLN